MVLVPSVVKAVLPTLERDPRPGYRSKEATGVEPSYNPELAHVLRRMQYVPTLMLGCLEEVTVHAHCAGPRDFRVHCRVA